MKTIAVWGFLVVFAVVAVIRVARAGHRNLLPFFAGLVAVLALYVLFR